MFSVLIDRFSIELRMWEWNKDSEWIIMILRKLPLLINESHYQVNHDEQTHSEIRSSWNDLSSPSGMKKINEKLIYIDLFVDIELKTDFRSQKSVLGRKCVKSSPLLKSHPQWKVCNHMGDLQNVFLDSQIWYGQTLLGSDQSGKDFRKITVKMSL